MSLWPVDDLATCIFMTRFYESLYNLCISDINIRARMVRGRAPDTNARPMLET
ncbi:MAG: CHAT domain-containing protein [Pseudomonadota bacterium]|nr:CHAT domain-containing protein [Pseudomonadota bacterium]